MDSGFHLQSMFVDLTPRRALGTVVAAGIALAPRAAFAHESAPPVPHDLWTAWTFDLVVVVLLLTSAAAFVFGAMKMRARMGRWPARFRVSASAFAAGWLVLAVTLVSPLHALGSALFSAHMAQHELMMVLAAPLLVAGRPIVPAVWSLPPTGRLWWQRLVHSPTPASMWRFLSRPAVAFLLHGVAIWVWHVPNFYDAAVKSELAHAAQHASFLTTALLFWWTVLPTSPARRNASSLFSLFGTALHTGLLGALLTFSDASWYPAYHAATGPWGLSPLEDQQLGGLIMWIPGGLTYLVVSLLTAARFLREPTRGWSENGVAGSLPA
jgi:cytochrome c oxidase assembly factor CtaG